MNFTRIPRTYDLSQAPSVAEAVLDSQTFDWASGLTHFYRDSWQIDTHKAKFSELPPGSVIKFLSTSDYSWSCLFTYGDKIIRAYKQPNNYVVITIADTTLDGSKELAELLKVLYPQAKPKPDQISLDFWYTGKNGPSSTSRVLDAPMWSNIKQNYPPLVRSALDRITKLVPSHSGQLMIWHGPPGTGKTYAIRALIRDWAPWCDSHLITDPENMLQDTDYLMNCLLSPASNLPTPTSPSGSRIDTDGYHLDDDDDEDSSNKKWKLVIFEDAGELLTMDAKERVGQGLARLLNVADGLIGQGLKLLVLITTNEPMSKLHPAVVRPGRCLAQVGFVPFTATEAHDWMLSHGFDFNASRNFLGANNSLAELYEKLAATQIVVTQPTKSVGF